MRRTRFLALASVLALAASPALGLPGPRADTLLEDAAPDDPLVEDHWVESVDTTMLRVTWFQPVGPGPFPVVLRGHGWAGERHLVPDELMEGLLGRGYAVLTWDARGFGESGGLVHLDSPDHEVRDVTALIDWLVREKPVRLDQDGDPLVAMAGGSYAGGIQLLAGVFDPRLDALAPEVTWNDLRHSLGPNGVLKLGWVGLLYGSGQAASHLGTRSDPARFHPNAGGVDPVLTQWLAESLAANELSDGALEGLAVRSIAHYLPDLERFPPTMLYQGWQDTLFTPNEAVWTYLALREAGFMSCILVHGGGHGYETPDEEYVIASILDFLDYYVLETTAPIPPPIEVYQPWDGAWSRLGDWPGATGTARWKLGSLAPAGGLALPTTGYLAADASGGLVAVPQTVAPAAITDVPNFREGLPLAAVQPPVLTASFLGPELSAARDVVGTPRLHLEVAGPLPDAALFVSILDVGPDGTEVVHNQVTPLRLATGSSSLALDLELTAIAHRFEAGHRIGLGFSTSDLGYLGARLPVPVLLKADGSSHLDLP